jgi:hypothetical protein
MTTILNTPPNVLVTLQMQINNNAVPVGYADILNFSSDFTATSDGYGTITIVNSDGTKWSLIGNSGTTPGTNFVGTTDSNDLVVKTNNIETARFTTSQKTLLAGAIDNTIDTLQLPRDGTINFPVQENFEDFLQSALGAGTTYSTIAVTANGGTAANEGAAVSNNYAGITVLSTGTTNNATGRGAVGFFNDTNKIALGVYRLFFEQRVRLPVLSTAGVGYQVFIGLMDGSGAGLPVNGIFFYYTHSTNAGNWRCVSRTASTSTNNESTVPVIADQWYKLRAEINAARTSILFFIDNVQVGSAVTTNIPAAATEMRFVYQIEKTSTSTTSRSLNIDYCWWKFYR